MVITPRQAEVDQPLPAANKPHGLRAGGTGSRAAILGGLRGPQSRPLGAAQIQRAD